ncbi:MAG TPA: hypothetical protein VLF67_02635, partial [Candidatus Saccharimonas sp.]|nr:hypothetical protein [Candidatus Saccharimonas sp.]
MGTSSPARRQLWLAAALLVAVSCGYALLAGQTTPDRAVLASSRVTYWIDQPSATLTARLRAAITASGLTPATASSAATADVLLSRTASAGATGITTLPAGQPVALTSSSGTIVGPNPKPDYYLTVRATGNPKLTALGTQLPTQLAGA